jgi:hypothetical protein
MVKLKSILEVPLSQTICFKKVESYHFQMAREIIIYFIIFVKAVHKNKNKNID